jgi:NAD(P) transhydrogenase
MTAENYDFDLLVIGSGPAGEKGAVQAAYFGKRVVVVERGTVGGTSANTGTLPSKTLRESALALSGFRQRAFRAVEVTLDRTLTLEDFLFRERLVREQERARVLANFDRHGVQLVRGDAAFVDEHHVRVVASDGSVQLISARFVLIATGSSPRRPEGIRFEDDRIFDSDEIADLTAIPRSLVISGGGVIGSEYACLFAALGVQVTLVERKERLLGFLDHEIADRLVVAMEALGIDLRLGCTVSELDLVHDGCRIELSSGERIDADAILYAAGRTGNTASLGLHRIGVEVNDRGHVVVDAQYRTASPSVYAAGDVVGEPALAATSMEQGRIAVVHAFDLRYKTSLAPMLPYGIYTIPEVSTVGPTERELQAAGVRYVVGRAEFSANARGAIIGERGGLLKLLFTEPDLELVGVHLVGEQATELVHIGLTALMLGATADVFIQTCFNHPTLAEVYKYAAYDALGHKARSLHGSGR